MKKLLLSAVSPIILSLLPCAPAQAQWATCGTGGKLCTNSEVAIGSGRPWCDPRAMSPPAAFDGSTDDTAAWNACITKLNALGGGTIRAPAGTSCIKTAGGISHTSGSPIAFVGAGMRATILDACGTDTTLLNVNVSKDQVRGMSIWGKGSGFVGNKGSFAAGFTKNTLEVGTSCVDCLFETIEVHGGAIPINHAGTDSRFINTYATWGYSTALIRIYAPNGSGNAGTRIIDGTFDQLWPTFAFPTSQCVAWVALHAYGTNECAVTGGFVIQYSVGGTSGAVAPTLNNYGVNITDGSATAQLAYRSGLGLMTLDSNASEVLVSKTDLSGASDYGLALTNSLIGNGPFYNHFDALIISGQNKHGVFLTVGHHIVIQNSHLLVCIDQTLAASCGAVTFSGAGWLGDALIANNFISGAYEGIILSGGAVRTYLSANTITTTTYGVDVFAGISNWSVKGGYTTGSSNGVRVQAGASDYYEIDTDTGTSTIADAGTGAHKIIIDRNTNTISANKIALFPSSVQLTATTSGAITIQPGSSAVTTYSYLLPTSAGTAGQPQLSGGGGSAQTYGTLSAAFGGTGATTLTSNGVLYGNGTGTIQATAQGAANTVLVANAGAPSFTAAPTFGTSATAPFFNATTVGTGYQINGVSIITTQSGEYLIFKGVASGHQIFLGGSSSDKTNYYANDTHTFRDFATTTNFVQMTSTKLSALQTTASTSSTTGSITAAGGLGAAGAIWAGTYVSIGAVAVASLPACGAGTEGARASVNNSNAASFTAGIGAVVAAGGTTHVPVYCDGTSWRIG